MSDQQAVTIHAHAGRLMLMQPCLWHTQQPQLFSDQLSTFAGVPMLQLIKAMKQSLVKQASAAVKNIGRIDQKPPHAQGQGQCAGASAPAEIFSDTMTQDGAHLKVSSAATLRGEPASAVGNFCSSLHFNFFITACMIDVS